ncbi:MAG TPA: rhodanese-like domain-containing protein [Bacteroidota bacterium]|nr:rhodanese-like domain-containing protein [Bacteroidota bacterium]
MKQAKTALILIVFAVSLLVATRVRADGSFPLLVTTDWLEKHLQDKDLVILHANWTNGSYKHGHIPGARFLWLNALAKDTPERNTEMPSLDDARETLRSLGINNDSHIVVYFEGQNITMATRMVLTLGYLGLANRVALLDGGFDVWKNERRPVSTVTPAILPGEYVPTLHPVYITDAGWVQAHLSDVRTTIIDARARRFYDGGSGTPPGHIPHALSVPFSSVVDSTNKLLPVDSLRAVFARAGVNTRNHLVTYCHVGQQATLVFLAARLIGCDVSVYDGSFQDWSDNDLPVENPAAKK